MEIWYEAAFRRIKAHDVEKASGHFLWIGGQRVKKDTDWRSWFPTWDEAHAWLLKQAEEEVISARRQLQDAQDKYGNVKGLRRPVTECDPHA